MAAHASIVAAAPRLRNAADWTAGLATRAANALRAHGFISRAQIERLSERRLLATPNLGRHSLADLRRWLAATENPS